MIASLIFSPSNGSLSSHVNAGYIPSDGEIVAPGMKASCGCYANLEQGVLLYGLDISQYTGKDIELSNFDLIKIGPYVEQFGPLNNPNTNQIMYKVVHENGKNELLNITNKFWKES